MNRRTGRAATVALMLGVLLEWGSAAAGAQTAERVGSVPPSPVASAAGTSASPARPTVGDRQTPTFFDLQKIQPGLEGWGLTVISGTQPERFPVEIVGLVKKASPGGGDLVMVRVGGVVVEKAGGIAAGMSGSPIYIGDQLVGALGYGFELADHSIGLVTPAAEMAKVLAQVAVEPGAAAGQANEVTAPKSTGPDDSRAATTARPTARSAQQVASKARGIGFERVVVAPSIDIGKVWQERWGSKVGVFAPVSVPVAVSGLSGRALQRLRQGLARYPVELVTGVGGAAAGQADEPTAAQLQWPAPGQACAVQLVRGDVDVSALGTITWADGKRFVGFGHPFLNKGSVSFLAGPAEMVGSVPSVSMPFKVGYPLAAAGAVLQDRMAAVAGRVGDLPQLTLVDVRVTEDGQSRGRTQAEVVWDEGLVGSLGSSVLLQAVDRALDRVGQGSATVTVTAKVAGVDTPVSRVNLFSSPGDISAMAVSEAAELLDLVAANPFQATHISALNVKVDVRSQRNEAEILRVKAPSNPVHPGDRVQLEVTLLPYRQPPETRLLVVQLPKDLPAGPLTVTVRGGGVYGGGGGASENPDTSGANKAGKGGGATDTYSSWLGAEKPPASLGELLDDFVGREHNNDLIAEFWGNPSAAAGSDASHPGASSAAVGVAENPGRTPKEGHGDGGSTTPSASGDQPAQTKLPTPYVIDGWIDVDLEVAEPEAAASPKPATPASPKAASPTSAPPATPTPGDGQSEQKDTKTPGDQKQDKPKVSMPSEP